MFDVITLRTSRLFRVFYAHAGSYYYIYYCLIPPFVYLKVHMERSLITVSSQLHEVFPGRIVFAFFFPDKVVL